MTSDEIKKLFPEVIRRTIRKGTPICALIDAMEQLQEPAKIAHATAAIQLQPYHADEKFHAYLAFCLDLDRFFPTGEINNALTLSSGTGRLRELMAAAPTLSKWRGTVRGLKLCLTVATGIDEFDVDEAVLDDIGCVRPFHIDVVSPAKARIHQSLITAIIEQEKPAFVSYDLRFQSTD